MKKLLILPVFMLSFLSGCDDKEQDIKPQIDLAAESIEFSVEKTGQAQGNITITGIVKNMGDPYRSRDGQQMLKLIQKDPSGAVTTLATKSFKDLDPGATIEIKHVIQGWIASMEFPPSFGLRISFDPDLYIDGNPQNDDANHENDYIERRGEEIHDLFY